MSNMEKIKTKLKKNNGILTTKSLQEKNIPTTYLSRLVKNGSLTRIQRGIYVSEDGDYDPYFFLNERYSTFIFSHLSSLYLHNFTDIIPQHMEITVKHGFNPHRLDKDISVHYVNKDIFNIGQTEIKTVYGNTVRVYDIERTICDIIANRKNTDTELFSKTINRYIKYGNKDMHKLYEYSKRMKVYEKVKNVMEIVYE